MDDRGSSSPRSPGGRWLIIAICGVVVVQIVYGILVFSLLGPPMDVRGQFGDIFGGVNALFTGLAFAGVIYTILLQRRELELQREELRLNRAELSRSAQAQMDQVSRLEEAADLSAVTALVNVYGSLLQPFLDSTQETRVQIAYFKQTLQRDDLSEKQVKDFQAKLNSHQRSLRMRETEWADTLGKHQRLVERLETLVEQRDQEQGN